MSLRVGPISWEFFWDGTSNRFFPRDQREEKMEEFINLCQGGMSVQEYSLKFIMFSKYTSSLVTNIRDEMSRFVIGVSDDLLEECRVTAHHNVMNLSILMVHAQQVL